MLARICSHIHLERFLTVVPSFFTVAQSIHLFVIAAPRAKILIRQVFKEFSSQLVLRIVRLCLPGAYLTPNDPAATCGFFSQ